LGVDNAFFLLDGVGKKSRIFITRELNLSGHGKKKKWFGVVFFFWGSKAREFTRSHLLVKEKRRNRKGALDVKWGKITLNKGRDKRPSGEEKSRDIPTLPATTGGASATKNLT